MVAQKPLLYVHDCDLLRSAGNQLFKDRRWLFAETPNDTQVVADHEDVLDAVMDLIVLQRKGSYQYTINKL